MKLQFAHLLFAACLVTACAKDLGSIAHPTPKDPVYLKASDLSTVRAAFPKPPATGSKEQATDEKAMHEIMQKRTKTECDRAQTEAHVSLANFYGAPYGVLTTAEVEKLSPFFLRLRNDADVFIQPLKVENARQRPFVYMKGVEACVSKELTLSYPSGHATLAKLYADVLSVIYPDRASKFQARALELANDRVLAGVHHPSDIAAGRILADLLFKDFAKSETYRADLAKLK